MRWLHDESFLRSVVTAFMQLVEAAGALVIFVGAALSLVRVVVCLVTRRGPSEFIPIRLDMGRFLGLGLEFQLAADLLRTAIAPTFQEIGMLASVAAIRTALNFFLSREIWSERSEMSRSQSSGASG